MMFLTRTLELLLSFLTIMEIVDLKDSDECPKKYVASYDCELQYVWRTQDVQRRTSAKN